MWLTCASDSDTKKKNSIFLEHVAQFLNRGASAAIRDRHGQGGSSIMNTKLINKLEIKPKCPTQTRHHQTPVTFQQQAHLSSHVTPRMRGRQPRWDEVYPRASTYSLLTFKCQLRCGSLQVSSTPIPWQPPSTTVPSSDCTSNVGTEPTSRPQRPSRGLRVGLGGIICPFRPLHHHQRNRDVAAPRCQHILQIRYMPSESSVVVAEAKAECTLGAGDNDVLLVCNST